MARDFPPDEAIFLQEYSAHCKKKWYPAGGKDPLFGRVDGFQIDPNKAAPVSHTGAATQKPTTHNDRGSLSIYLSRLAPERQGIP